MALFNNPFRKKPDPATAALRERIRAWAGAALGQPAGLDMTVSEVECPDPACPGFETFLLVMRPGEATQAVKVKKALDQVEEADVREALRYL